MLAGAAGGCWPVVSRARHPVGPGPNTRLPGPIPGPGPKTQYPGPRPGPPPDMCRGKLAFNDFFFWTSLKTVQALNPGALVERNPGYQALSYSRHIS